MRHMAAYSASIASGATLAQLSALADPVMIIPSKSVITRPKLDHILAILGFGVNLTRVQIQSPSLRPVGFYEVRPIANVAPVGDQVLPFCLLADEPLKLDVGEEIPVWATQNLGSAQTEYVFLDLCDGPQHPVKGKIYSLHATSATTLTGGGWTQCTLTLEQPIPNRRFSLVGARVKSATGLAFRFIVPGIDERPGGFCASSDLSLIDETYRRGGLGVWFDFDYLTVPYCEIFATAADTAQDVILDVLER